MQTAARNTEKCFEGDLPSRSIRPPQAESLWLHLPIITELATMCHRVFAGGSVQYAYTTIPTYPRCCTMPAGRALECFARVLLGDPMVIETFIKSAAIPTHLAAADRQIASWSRDWCLPCSGQIGFMICSKKAADGSALDTRVSRQPPPQRGDYPPLRWAMPVTLCGHSCVTPTLSHTRQCNNRNAPAAGERPGKHTRLQRQWQAARTPDSACL
jgi:hypothetical protein